MNLKPYLNLKTVICKKGKKRKKNFQRLEFLGDKVLGLILTSIIFDQYEKAFEGSYPK